VIGYILAIGAAATWSMVALSATRIVRYFGSYNYNLLRLVGIIVLFLPYIVVNWDPIYFNKSIFIAIFLSSVILKIFISSPPFGPCSVEIITLFFLSKYNP